MTNEDAVALSTDIVVAYVGKNSISPAELLDLVRETYDVVAGLGHDAHTDCPAATAEEPLSLDKNSVTCLECGFKGKMLRRHLGAEHGLTPAEYRTKWNLPFDYPLVSASYSSRRKELANEIGLGKTFGRGKARSKTPSPPAPKQRKKRH